MTDKFNERPEKNEKNESIEYVEKLIKKAKLSGNSDDITQLEKIIDLIKFKKYGLVWEKHSEKVEEAMKTKLPVFVENKKKEINDKKDDDQFNFLIEGDNLHSLHLLEKTHSGKIDIIYIDPPYNTGNNDFKYNDNFIDFSDSFKHSKWLSFMETRLRIAKKLLSSNGVIFVSIDNKEGYQLKLLMDEIFGEEHLAADFHVETSAVAGPRRFAASKGSVVKTTEFVFAYSNGNNSIIKRLMYDGISGYDKHYSKFLNEKNGEIITLSSKIKDSPELLSQFKKAGLRVDMIGLAKLIEVNPIIKNWIYKEEVSKNIFREGDPIKTLSEDELKKVKKNRISYINGKYITLNKKGNPIVLFRYFDRLGYSDDYLKKYGERTIRGNLWKGFSADGGNLSSEGGISFKNGKKPIRLIEQLIKASTEKNKTTTVLDFFAGSGTTGESVMELNNENLGKYQFILATNDEVIETTYKRMKNVSSKIPLNLKYLKTDFIEKDKFPGYSLYEELTNYIEPLIELEFGVDVSRHKVEIVMNEEKLESLFESNLISKDEYIFMNPNIFLDSYQKQKLLELNVKVQEIPDYFFGEEVWS